MQVFKLFLKIIKKNIFLVILYLAIFTLISVFIVQGQAEEVKETKIASYILVEEENEDSLEFVNFLNNYVEPVPLKSGISVEDALFWDDIDLYIYIPRNFYDKILEEEEGILIKSSPDALEVMTFISTITSFFNTLRESVNLGICDKENAISYTAKLFQDQNNVSIELITKQSTGIIRGMFDYAAYVICALILVIVGLVSFEIRTTEISRRLRISAYSTGKRNFMLALCYGFFAIIFVGIITCLGMILFPNQINSRIGYYILNSIIFAITIVFMALFLSSIFKSSMAYSCVSNVIPLVAAFLCGCFINLDLMPTATKAVGHIFPHIYFVEANQYIQTTQAFNFLEYLGIIWPYFLFIAIFMLGSILITNYMSKSEN